MTGEEQVQSIKQAIASLFENTNLFTSSGDAGHRAEMREKQMAYGILLHSCGLMETKNTESRILEMKRKLSDSSRVSIMQAFTSCGHASHPCSNIMYFSIISSLDLRWSVIVGVKCIIAY